MERRHLCQNVRVSGYQTRGRREQLCVCERERGAPARGVCARVSDTEGRAGRAAGGRGQPARGGSVPAWSRPIRSCVSEGIQSAGRAGCALRRERRQHGASSGRRAAQAAAPARPALRAAGTATAAAPPPATAPPVAVPRPGTERPAIRTEVSPGLPVAAARDPPPARPPRGGPGPGCGAQADAAGPGRPGRRLGPGRAFRSLGRPAPVASRGAGCGPRSAPPRAGGADRTRRSASFLSQAGASERAGGREEAPGRAHICAPGTSVWPPRSDVDPPAPDLNRPRCLACPPRCERPLPRAERGETHRRPPPSLRAAEPPASAGTSPPSPASRRRAGAGCAGPRQAAQSPRWQAGRCGRTPGARPAGRSGRAAASGRADPASAGGGGGSGPGGGLKPPAGQWRRRGERSWRPRHPRLGVSREIGPARPHAVRLILAADVGGEGLRLHLGRDAIAASHPRE